MQALTSVPHMLHGCDYNPEQWLNRPDILAQDIEQMKQAKINCVSIGIFAWAALEPREGDYQLDWLANMPLPHGVDLFFVLSGFLIGLSVMRMAAREDKWHQTWRFYGKTALRILPNYYALLLVNLLLVSLGVINADLHATPMYQYITLTQNVFTPFYGFYWESWSVPIQWWFYIFFPLLVIAVRRVSGRYSVPVVVVLAVAGSLLFRALTCMGVDDP